MQTEEHTILDDLNLIEKVKNETPWNTADLAGFLVPYIKKHGFESITVETLNPTPGVKREKQPLVRAFRHYRTREDITVRLLSPKRAAARTDLLDRLAVSEDLKASEACMPKRVVAQMAHAIDNIISDANNRWKCSHGSCECPALLIDHGVIIRGCTKARTRPRKTLARLETELRWATNSIAKLQAKLEKEITKRDRLQKRVDKRRADDSQKDT